MIDPVTATALLLRVKGFLKHYGKYILVAIGVVMLLLAVRAGVRAIEARGFNRGVNATLSKVRQEIGKRDVVNRAIEKKSQEGVDEFAKDKVKEAEKRDKVEQKKADKIATVVDTVPMWKSEECSLTPQILSERNAIRALGPKE
jgi:hypothetical protein